MNRKAVISTVVAPVHKEPLFNSEMVTQALLWENVEILDEDKLWFHIRQVDGYAGWVYTFFLLENSESYDNWITLKKRFTPFTNSENKNSEGRFLSFGTRVPVVEANSKSIKISLPGDIIGTIPFQTENLIKSRKVLINLAKSLLGTPYIWGGKSAFGFDCSGFVQLVLSTMGLSIDRDTGMQVKSSWLQEIKPKKAKPGDLVYFAEDGQINHVGFSMGEGKIIHCSGEVKIESINEENESFNQYLNQSIYKAFSISEKVID